MRSLDSHALDPIGAAVVDGDEQGESVAAGERSEQAGKRHDPLRSPGPDDQSLALDRREEVERSGDRQPHHPQQRHDQHAGEHEGDRLDQVGLIGEVLDDAERAPRPGRSRAAGAGRRRGRRRRRARSRASAPDAVRTRGGTGTAPARRATPRWRCSTRGGRPRGRSAVRRPRARRDRGRRRRRAPGWRCWRRQPRPLRSPGAPSRRGRTASARPVAVPRASAAGRGSGPVSKIRQPTTRITMRHRDGDGIGDE